MTPHISTTLLRTQSDERLARLAAEGHERAFEAIVERYRRPLTRFAQRFVGEARAEEVVQTAFLNAWNSLRSGTEVRDLKPWLYRIVNNGAINALQRAEYSDAPLIEANDTRLGPEAAFEQSEELRLTVEGIGELPERQREALLAVAVDGRAHADVARDLGVSDAGVRQLVRRARVQLRAAATAITPIPLAVWIAKGGLASGATAAGGTAAAGGSAVGGGSAAGTTAVGGAALGGAVKTGAIVASMAVVATGGTEVVKKVEEKNSNRSPMATLANARPGERTLIPGADPTMMIGNGRAQVRVVTGPDGQPRVVMQMPGSSTPVMVPVDSVPVMAPAPAPIPGVPVSPSPGQEPRQVAGVFNPSMPSAPAPSRGGEGGSGEGPRQLADVPATLPTKPGSTPSAPGGGSLPGSGSPGKPAETPAGSRPVTTPSTPGGSPRPVTTPSAPASPRPVTTPSAPASPTPAPVAPAPKPQKPAEKPDKPEKPTSVPSRPESGDSGKGNSGSSPGTSGDPGKTAPSPGKGGGKGKGGDD
ncbi:MAG: sigma-70 family RNA polymerase sigma factor [Solirubrobacteraceae bacterium]|nr:sigma-70 family RNA polymerase sigma factor [Solirubrobacteraceae bacterium]